MKLILLYTSYRQVDEIYFNSIFFNNSEFLKKHASIIFHCNHSGIPKDKVKKYLNNYETEVEFIHTDKNAGFQLGPLEAHNDLFDYIQEKNADYLIHSHPDIHIINDSRLKQTCENGMWTETQFYVHRMTKDIDFTYDFYMYKPKNMINIFANWEGYDDRPEHFLYERILDNNLKYEIIKRHTNDHAIGQREKDCYGLWHEHDNREVFQYIVDNNLKTPEEMLSYMEIK